MNRIIFTVSIFLSVLLGYWLGGHQGNDVKPEENIPFDNNERADLLEKIKILTAENKKLSADKYSKSQSSYLPKDNSQKVTAKTVIQSSSINQTADNLTKEGYELKERASSFTNWLTKNHQEKPWFDLGIEMRGRFDAEETDYNWASAEEGHIQSLFVQQQTLAGIAVKSTTCKSTQCQITISVMDQDHANETAMTITRVLSGENFSQIIIDSQVQQGETILYVARNEKGFEFN